MSQVLSPFSVDDLKNKYDLKYLNDLLCLSPCLYVTVFVFQVFMLSCSFPRRPDNGDVTVMDLHAGGTAHFHCYMGYELEGSRNLTCINSSKPRWSDKEPICLGR